MGAVNPESFSHYQEKLIFVLSLASLRQVLKYEMVISIYLVLVGNRIILKAFIRLESLVEIQENCFGKKKTILITPCFMRLQAPTFHQCRWMSQAMSTLLAQSLTLIK